MAEHKGKKGASSNTRVYNNCLTPEGSDGVPKLTACVRCGIVVYCSKECQRAHWKANPKQHCIAKADRVPSGHQLKGHKDTPSKTLSNEGECSICLGSLVDALVTTLQCNHVLHVECVEELRKFGVRQTCPLCRTPLSLGPEQFFEKATRRCMVIDRMAARGEASWCALPASAQAEINAAVTEWQGAAEQGYAMAQQNLGCVLTNGYGVARNDVEAAKWFQTAAEQGCACAQVAFGQLFEGANGVQPNYTVAAQWYRRAADQGDADAQSQLGGLYKDGRGVKQSDAMAARGLKEAADQGDATAQHRLGIMFMTGEGVAQSDEKAAQMYRKAADQGMAEAQCNLGNRFECGRGVPRSHVQAARWYQKAADQGLAMAQCNLANLFSQGLGGVSQSDVEAARRWETAAEQGDIEALHNIGV